MATELRFVDPGTLRLPRSRPDGASPAKFHLQVSRFGKSLEGMPPICVYETRDGELLIYDGVTRASRAAKLCPGELVPVEVIGVLNIDGKKFKTIEEKLP